MRQFSRFAQLFQASLSRRVPNTYGPALSGALQRLTVPGIASAPRQVGGFGRLHAAPFSSSDYPPPNLSRAGTADLCDVYHPEEVDVTIAEKQIQIVDPGINLRDYGGVTSFSGQISTIKCYENNPLVRAALSEPGNGRVLVVDAGASLRCALLGDNLAEIGATNGWQGVVLYGCVRDAKDIETMQIGVKALNTHPLKSSKRDPGIRDIPVTFGGVTFRPGEYIFADKDGIVVAPEPLVL